MSTLCFSCSALPTYHNTLQKKSHLSHLYIITPGENIYDIWNNYEYNKFDFFFFFCFVWFQPVAYKFPMRKNILLLRTTLARDVCNGHYTWSVSYVTMDW